MSRNFGSPHQWLSTTWSIGQRIILAATTRGGIRISETGTESGSARDFVDQSNFERELDEKYGLWKSLLSPERRVWEEILESNLGDFYLPLNKRDRLAGTPNAWDFVADDPALPRVLLIGDSVSRGYTTPVRGLLSGRANVHRAPENCGSSANGLRKLDLYLGTGQWHVIHFNFGVHDRDTPVEVYERNLELIINRLKLTGAALIWASSTPAQVHIRFRDFFSRKSLRYFVRGDPIVIRNVSAARIAQWHGIRVNDLYAYVFPRITEFQRPDSVHLSDAGYEFLGIKVAVEIAQLLPKSKRVLL